MNQKNFTLAVVCLLMATATIFSCSKDDSDDPKPTISILSNPELSSHDVGAASFDFKASDAWTLTTSDTRAAATWFEVDKTSGGAGTHTISITITEANPLNTAPRVGYISISSGTVSKTVTVSQPANDQPGINEDVAVTDVSLNKNEMTLAAGDKDTLVATVNPTNATRKGVTWSSGDSLVARVSSSGEVTAIKKGNTIITVTTDNGSKTATCAVTVTAKDTTVTYAIGDYYPNPTEASTAISLVFYLTNPSDGKSAHGKIVTLDEEVEKPWLEAKKWCEDKNIPTQPNDSSWYFPTINELTDELYPVWRNDITFFNDKLINAGGMPISPEKTTEYWSCMDNGDYHSWKIFFGGYDTNALYANNLEGYSVRAMVVF